MCLCILQVPVEYDALPKNDIQQKKEKQSALTKEREAECSNKEVLYYIISYGLEFRHVYGILVTLRVSPV